MAESNSYDAETKYSHLHGSSSLESLAEDQSSYFEVRQCNRPTWMMTSILHTLFVCVCGGMFLIGRIYGQAQCVNECARLTSYYCELRLLLAVATSYLI